MILEAGSRFDASLPGLTGSWEDERFFVGWKGLVFILGQTAGRPSIEILGGRLRNLPVARAVRPLKGDFLLIVYDKSDRKPYILTDHSRQYTLFHSRRAIGNSYLDLIHHLDLGRSDVSPAAVVEFLRLGSLPFEHTFTPAIDKATRDTMLSFAPDGTVEIIDKDLPALEQAPDLDFGAYFTQLARSLADQKLSVDLTGGFDSRLIACLLAAAGLDFEVAISGASSLSEIEIGKQVADVLGRDYFVTYHRTDDLEAELLDLFRINDGLGDVLAFHRISQFQRDKRDRGVTLGLSGAAGELYKDYWWLQDFPFYNTSRPDLERLYKLRIEPIGLADEILAGDYRTCSRDFRSNTIAKLAVYGSSSNTRTYDNIYYHFRMLELISRMLTTTTNHILPVYAPLLELDLVRFGFGLPRRRRVFNIFHRQMLYRCHRPAARIRTTEGVSASLAPLELTLDLFRYAGDKGQRMTKKVLQRVFGRTYLQESADDPAIAEQLRSGPLLDRAIDHLIEAGVLAGGADQHGIDARLHGRLLTLDFLLREFN